MKQISDYDKTVRGFAENGRLMKLGLAQIGWKLRYSTFEESCRNGVDTIDEDIWISESEYSKAIDEAWEMIQ